MTTCLVDVLNNYGNVLHTFPISLEDESGVHDDAAYQAKALEAAAYAQLLPDSDLQWLSARIHISRGGQLEPYGDPLDVDAETEAGLEREVREQAYLIWKQEGCPEGQAEKYWYQALEQNRRKHAYMLWQLKGCPEGSAEEDWQQAIRFEKQ